MQFIAGITHVFIGNRKINGFLWLVFSPENSRKYTDQNVYSIELALAGLDPAQREELTDLLKTVEKNVTANWHFVKNGGKRKY